MWLDGSLCPLENERVSNHQASAAEQESLGEGGGGGEENLSFKYKGFDQLSLYN